MYNHNFNYCSVWVWNLFLVSKGRTLIEGVLDQGAAQNIWT